jgi:hypothetical protein
MSLIITQKALKKPPWVDSKVPEAALRRDNTLAHRHEPRFTRAFMKLSRSLLDAGTKKRLLAALRDAEAGRGTIEDAVEAVQWYNPADPMASKRWELLLNGLRRAYGLTIEDAGETEFKRQGWRLKFEVQKQIHGDPSAIRVPINPFSIKYINEHSAGLVVDISDQQRQMLRRLIAEAFDRGERPKKILDLIAELIGLTDREAAAVVGRETAMLAEGVPAAAAKKASRLYAIKLLKVRSKRIARTETKDAYEQGLADSWQLAKEEGEIDPTVMKEWVEVTLSPRTCKVCRGLGGQRVPVDEPFVSDIIGTLDRPAAHPNCRCTMVLVFPDDDVEALDRANADARQAYETLAGS